MQDSHKLHFGIPIISVTQYTYSCFFQTSAYERHMSLPCLWFFLVRERKMEHLEINEDSGDAAISLSSFLSPPLSSFLASPFSLFLSLTFFLYFPSLFPNFQIGFLVPGSQTLTLHFPLRNDASDFKKTIQSTKQSCLCNNFDNIVNTMKRNPTRNVVEHISTLSESQRV